MGRYPGRNYLTKKKAALAYDSDRLNFTQRSKATQTFQHKMLRTMKQQKDE